MACERASSDVQDLPGFLYAYELRGVYRLRYSQEPGANPLDLQTSRVSYYKIGRTDNVPRRMSEWSSRQSCTPSNPLKIR
jgi:hypothetical protein